MLNDGVGPLVRSSDGAVGPAIAPTQHAMVPFGRIASINVRWSINVPPGLYGYVVGSDFVSVCVAGFVGERGPNRKNRSWTQRMANGQVLVIKRWSCDRIGDGSVISTDVRIKQ